MSGRLRLRAVTPDRVVLEQEADLVILRTVEGDKGILPGHEAYSAPLAEGVLKIFEGKRQTGALAVLGGFATVEGDCVTVLTPIAERPERVQELLADMERQREEKRNLEARSELEISLAESALRRMLVQGGLSTRSALHGLDAREDGDEEG